MDPSTQQHSYDFDRFGSSGQTQELCRLHRQATAAQTIEQDFLRSLKVPATASVLDVGCGPGFVTGLLAQTFAQGQCYGVDSSQDLLASAQALVSARHANVHFRMGSAYCLPFPDATFDLVYARMLYQHLDNAEQALDEARRVTKHGGSVCIVDIDAEQQYIEPHCPAFDRLNALAVAAQARLGGDRYISRKLPRLMAARHFSKVQYRCMPITSLDIPTADFLDITTNFKAMQAGTEEARSLVREISAFCEQTTPPPFIYVAAFAAIGTV